MKRALIVIDHGSRLAAANELLERIAARLRETSGFDFVEHAHMELAPPTLAEAWTKCAAQGAGEIVLVPYFLAAGGHATDDIPRMALEAAAGHPEIHWKLAEPLGLDDRILEVVKARAAKARRADP